MRTGRKRVLIVLGLCGIVPVAILLVVVGFSIAGSERWQSMVDRMDARSNEMRSRSRQRTVLRGEPLPGNAWDEYALAFKDIRGMEHPNQFNMFLEDSKYIDPSQLRQALAQHQDAIRHLHLGTQRANGHNPRWNRALDYDQDQNPTELASLATAQARVWSEEGRTREAADLLLDVCVFAADAGANGARVGTSGFAASLNELWRMILSGKLTQKELASIANQLERLDREYPSFVTTVTNDGFTNELYLVEDASSRTGSPEWRNLVKADWRFAATPKQLVADAFEEREGYLKRYQKIDELEYAVARKEIEAIDAERRASSNGLTRWTAAYPIAPHFLYSRLTLSSLRLLRAATHFLATGDMPTIRDPFGGNLLFKHVGNTTTIWSVGPDGTNQNGTGDDSHIELK